MRLMTRDIHRAFPELDRFSDEQCSRYLDRIRSTNAYQLSVIGGGLLGAAFGVFASFIVLAILHSFADKTLPSRAAQSAFGGIAIASIVGTPAVFALIGRDQVLELFVRRTIGRTKCITCRYSLLGQIVIDDRVRCPECGSVMTLDDLGIQSAEELTPRIDSPL